MTEMIELLAVPDTFVTGLGMIETIMGGACLRLYFYARQGKQRILVAKLVTPTECLQKMIAQRTALLQQAEGSELLHLH